MPLHRTYAQAARSAFALLVTFMLPTAGCEEETPRSSRHPCADVAQACDGTVEVPLDWNEPDGETIEVAFRIIPRREARAPSAGIIFGAIGGPAEGISLAPLWQKVLGDALDDHDLLMMDYRGFGRSTPLTCPGLGLFRDDLDEIRACAAGLGQRATKFGTAASANDLRAVLDALAIDQVDMVAESYGTYFAQAFAVRHSTRLRRLVLDGVVSPEWLPEGNVRAAMLRHVVAVCADSPGCEITKTELEELLARAAEQARAPSDGAIDVVTLRGVVGNYSDRLVTPELVPALRAFVAGDEGPLTRLVSELDSIADEFSEAEADTDLAAFFSYWCNDVPLPYARTASESKRITALRKDLERATYLKDIAPFTSEENVSVGDGRHVLSEAEACTVWPADGQYDAPVSSDSQYPDIPVLLISGSDDETTPVEGAREVARRFPRANHVVVPFGEHFASFVYPCAAELVRAFLETGEPPEGAVDCRGQGVRMVRRYPRQLDELSPAPTDGGVTPDEARLLRAVVLTVSDAASPRTKGNDLGSSLTQTLGVRGGRARYDDRDDGTTAIALEEYAWIDGVPVTGEVTRQVDGSLVGTVEVRASGGSVSMELTYEPLEELAEATANVRARFGDRSVSAHVPAWLDP